SSWCSTQLLYELGKSCGYNKVCVFSTGEHLRVCSQEYTCCGVEMEEALTHRSKADLEHLMEEISGALRNILTTKHRKFDGETQEVKNI
ncbi:glypican-6a isoform X1, partial [Tachysurus ichikawai]